MTTVLNEESDHRAHTLSDRGQSGFAGDHSRDNSGEI